MYARINQLLFGAVTLGFIVTLAWCGILNSEIRSLNATVAKMAKAPSKLPSTSLDVQLKCANQAARVFADLGWKKEPSANYENHYNARLDRCFLLISYTDLSNGRVMLSNTLSDAIEGHQFASYVKFADAAKPFICSVLLENGTRTDCSEQPEWERLVSPYLEGRVSLRSGQ